MLSIEPTGLGLVALLGFEMLRPNDFIVLQIVPTSSIAVYSDGRVLSVAWDR